MKYAWAWGCLLFGLFFTLLAGYLITEELKSVRGAGHLLGEEAYTQWQPTRKLALIMTFYK